MLVYKANLPDKDPFADFDDGFKAVRSSFNHHPRESLQKAFKCWTLVGPRAPTTAPDVTTVVLYHLR